MDMATKLKCSIFVVVTGLTVWFAVLAVQFGNKISHQTEQNFADAIRTMQGGK